MGDLKCEKCGKGLHIIEKNDVCTSFCSCGNVFACVKEKYKELLELCKEKRGFENHIRTKFGRKSKTIGCCIDAEIWKGMNALRKTYGFKTGEVVDMCMLMGVEKTSQEIKKHAKTFSRAVPMKLVAKDYLNNFYSSF